MSGSCQRAVQRPTMKFHHTSASFSSGIAREYTAWVPELHVLSRRLLQNLESWMPCQQLQMLMLLVGFTRRLQIPDFFSPQLMHMSTERLGTDVIEK